MAKSIPKRVRQNFFLNLHPVKRLLISVIVAISGYLIMRMFEKALVSGIVMWCIFSFVYLLLSWFILFNRNIEQLTKQAKSQDGSEIFVFILILVSAFASLATVMVLIISGHASKEDSYVIIASAFSILLSWMMVHSTYTFHYAHLYYNDDQDDSKKRAGGLNFPGSTEPGYLDFAYFSFVIGMTFQVSDVEITSPALRRKALAHGLISFVLNTFVVALTINLIGSMH